MRSSGRYLLWRAESRGREADLSLPIRPTSGKPVFGPISRVRHHDGPAALIRRIGHRSARFYGESASAAELQDRRVAAPPTGPGFHRSAWQVPDNASRSPVGERRRERRKRDAVIEASADPFGRKLNLVANEIRTAGDVRPESEQVSAIHVLCNRPVDRRLPRLASLKHFYVKPDIEVPFLPHEVADLCAPERLGWAGRCPGTP
jgi:hypothetical protein